MNTHRNAYKGQKMIVCGGGVSMLQHSVQEITEYRTVGCNQISKLFDPDHVTLVDPPISLSKQAGLKAPRHSIENSHVWISRGSQRPWRVWMKRMGVKPKDLNLFKFFYDGKNPWGNYHPDDYELLREKYWDSTHEKCPLTMPYGPTSLGVAAMIAIYLGASKIGVLGLDYHGGYFWKKNITWLQSGPSAIRLAGGQWCRLSLMAKKVFDVEVVNLSKDSKIKTFPFQALEDF